MFHRRDRNEREENAGPVQDQDNLLVGEDIDSGEPVLFPIRESFSHWHVPGAPGTGKTSLLELLLRFLITNDYSCCLIDPLGPLFDRVVNWLAHHPEHAKDVIIISPGDTNPYWPGFNPLKQVDYIQDLQVHADMIADSIAKVFGDDRQNTPLLSRKSEEAAEPLIQNGLTFLEMPYFYQLNRGDVRAKFVAKSEGAGIREEWEDFENLSRTQKRDELGSLRNRLPRFVRNHAVRMLLGRNENTINIPDVVENRKKLLINLAPKQGLLGRTHSYMLGSLFIGAITSYIRTRTQKQADATPYWLVADEFHNMLTPDISSALDELRNFNLKLVMSHQRFGQLLREDVDLLDAVMIDAGIKVVFGRLSPEALDLLEPMMYLGEHDFNKVKYQTYSDQEAVPHFFTLDELRYQRQVELYRQPRQHMTLKILEATPQRIKVASVEPYPRDNVKHQALMNLIVQNHPHYYLEEDEILRIITERQEALEAPDEDEEYGEYRT